DEHVDEAFVVRVLREDLLDRDLLLESRDALRSGNVDLGHSSSRDPTQQGVATELPTAAEIAQLLRRQLDAGACELLGRLLLHAGQKIRDFPNLSYPTKLDSVGASDGTRRSCRLNTPHGIPAS